ncbi:MAG: hypothetical protein ACFCU6_09465 [Balneolaceae bacterium]
MESYFDYNSQDVTNRHVVDTLQYNDNTVVFDFYSMGFFAVNKFNVHNKEIIFYDDGNKSIYIFDKENTSSIKKLAGGEGRGPKDILGVQSLSSTDQYFAYSDQVQHRVTVFDKNKKIVFQEVMNAPVESLYLRNDELYYLKPSKLDEMLSVLSVKDKNEKIVIESIPRQVNNVIPVQMTGRLAGNDVIICHLGYWSGFLNCYDKASLQKLYSRSVINMQRFAKVFQRVIEGGLASGIEKGEVPASLEFTLNNDYLFVIPAERISKKHLIDIYDVAKGNYLKSIIFSEEDYLIRSISIDEYILYMIIQSDERSDLKLVNFDLRKSLY